MTRVDVRKTYKLYIGGQFVEPASGEYFKTINPATEEVLSAIPVAGKEDVDRAVGAAARGRELEPGAARWLLADHGQRLVRPLRIAGQERLSRLGVEGDHADVVGGDVVELAGHPASFFFLSGNQPAAQIPQRFFCLSCVRDV